MLSTLLLFLGDISGSALLLTMAFIFGLPLLLLLLVVWRWFRPQRHATAPLSVADELSKLQQLREQGVLTAQEFEQQKQRVLR